ncbi:hypothetical protein LGL08_01860 [Clostridium estertheticum]|uniref:hypothetical protein n=1 Tax=Clostridium estertheticum TaxID=238834 RepID=UPI001CF16F70|nr:hypothetical protein [Clostridium estertheticum]MCB2307141.1 hypothetical protein [Clostridium estertheticum]MCB2344069.1 hypothetical protein [Clostridium estertheticum]MCB2348317.1 hypothetical protein [Clostridium estertheticum]WAG45948.1 hypothetical protein LL127_20955 [Clostridium estertheticum]
MNKYNLKETKQSDEQSGDNDDVSGASNAKVTQMYNMPNMTSGPSDATTEEKEKLYGRSIANKGINRK